MDELLKIVIPMAGEGRRFSLAGYKDPKPLIPIHGVPMIQLVINNLRPKQAHQFIFICQQAHIESYNLREKLSQWSPGCQILGLNSLTEGAACTVLAAKELLNPETPLMIANSDQYISMDINSYLSEVNQQFEKGLDGLLMTMKASDPKWSYVALDTQGKVSRIAEKEVISEEATVGIYNFRKSDDFVSAAEDMIAQNSRVNGEFYVAPTYNHLIQKGKCVGVLNIGKEADGVYGLGVPADLEAFLALNLDQEMVAAG